MGDILKSSKGFGLLGNVLALSLLVAFGIFNSDYLKSLKMSEIDFSEKIEINSFYNITEQILRDPISCAETFKGKSFSSASFSPIQLDVLKFSDIPEDEIPGPNHKFKNLKIKEMAVKTILFEYENSSIADTDSFLVRLELEVESLKMNQKRTFDFVVFIDMDTSSPTYKEIIHCQRGFDTAGFCENVLNGELVEHPAGSGISQCVPSSIFIGDNAPTVYPEPGNIQVEGKGSLISGEIKANNIKIETAPGEFREVCTKDDVNEPGCTATLEEAGEYRWDNCRWVPAQASYLWEASCSYGEYAVGYKISFRHGQNMFRLENTGTRITYQNYSNEVVTARCCQRVQNAQAE